LKNPDFYKKFLIKEKSYIYDLKESLDNPKTQFLKYFLLKFAKQLEPKYAKKIYFLINTYLKDIKAQKTNINIFQYEDLKTIIATIYYIVK